MDENWAATKKDAARFFGVSTQALDGWFNRGCPADRDDNGRIKSVSLSEMAQWRINAAGADESTGSYEQERTRLTKAQADKTELEVSVLRGDLIPAEIVERVWGSMLGAFRARCLGIPTKAAHAILAVADLHEAETILKDHVHEALTELADYDATQYGVKAGQESLAGDSATSRDDGEPVGGCVPATKQRGKRGARKMEH